MTRGVGRVSSRAPDPALVLASGSPRRLALLRQLGLDPEVRVPDVDERALPGEAPRDQLLRLAGMKADTVADALADTITRAAPSHAVPVVLGADTMIVHAGEALGKPRDRAHFLQLMRRLGGTAHNVCTAVTVRRGSHRDAVLVTSEVRLATFGRERASAYWASGEPADKAGGYAVQGRGARFVVSLSGSYSNVVGLPLFESARLLEAAGLVLD